MAKKTSYRAEVGDKIRVVEKTSPHLRRTGTVVREMVFRPGILKVRFDGDPASKVEEVTRQQCVVIREPGNLAKVTGKED